MDNAVALVRAYLQLNGYFTITEYPVVRKMGDGIFRTLTEVDVAGFHLVNGEPDFETDVVLGVPRDRPDMIIGEVKEGRAEINQSATDPDVLTKILRRFGCCPAGEARNSAQSLLARGTVDTRAGHRIRLVAFGTSIDSPGHYLKIRLSDVVAYVDRYISENWEVVRASGSRDPIFGVMVLLAKSRAAPR